MKRTLIIAATLLAATVATAQESITYEPVVCVRASEVPVLKMNVKGEGVLRAYFRRIETADWCMVEGENDGAMSRAMLPKFAAGDELEYFFVLVQGARVMARSPKIYRVRVTDQCETPFARYSILVQMNCGDNANGGNIASSLGAGYAIRDTLINGETPYGSPDRPVPTGRRNGRP